MTYYSNPNDLSFYHTAEKIQVTHPSLNGPPAIDPFHGQAHDILGESWGMVPWQGPLFDFPTSLPGEENFGEQNYNHLAKYCLTCMP